MLNYKEIIDEDVESLQECERQQKHAKLRDRVRMLRLLKSGKARSLAVAGSMVGISASQAGTLFRQYRQEGLSEFTRWRYGGNHRKLTAEQQQELVSRMSETPNDFSSQSALGQYIFQSFGVRYTQSGISVLCSRNGIKAKVGRPRNKASSEEEQQAYKKNSVRL